MHRGQMLLTVYSDLQQLLHQIGVGGASKSQDRTIRSRTGPSPNMYRQELERGTTDWTQVR